MKVPGRFDALFRQFTPLFLLGVLAATICEPWLPGTAWLRHQFGETAVLRACMAALCIYVLLLWGESLRLHNMLTAVLQAFREFGGGKSKEGQRNPKARLEAARLLIAALASEDPEIRATSHHNLVRLAGADHGPVVGPSQTHEV
ncbi:MAG: hypothetical protein ABIP94_04155, partial [Planctomycetota bacterium]